MVASQCSNRASIHVYSYNIHQLQVMGLSEILLEFCPMVFLYRSFIQKSPLRRYQVLYIYSDIWYQVEKQQRTFRHRSHALAIFFRGVIGMKQQSVTSVKPWVLIILSVFFVFLKRYPAFRRGKNSCPHCQ